MSDEIEIPAVFKPLLNERWRYKVFYGGRGGGKSWAFAIALILLSISRRIRVLCTREYQNSIEDSVYKLISDLISKYNTLTYSIKRELA